MRSTPFRRFRTKLLVVMMTLVATLTVLGFLLAQRKVSSEAEANMRSDFQYELADLQRVQAVRNAALTEMCRSLVLRPRIHAALEDNALDVLYLSAHDEMQDVMRGEDDSQASGGLSTLQATFYRFLDDNGKVISPPASTDAGRLTAAEEAQLSLSRLPEKEQLGYLLRTRSDGKSRVDEVIAIPIVSTESGNVIAALVLGFDPTSTDTFRATDATRSGIFLGGHLEVAGQPQTVIDALAQDVARAITSNTPMQASVPVNIAGEPYLLFYKQLNPASLFPPAYEVVIYPLAQARAREKLLFSQVALGGLLLLIAGVLASHFLATRLSVPVEKLEVDSQEDRVQRKRAETALEITSGELQRASHFSADASHQLKTPLTVLRAGLEEMLTRADLSADMRKEVAALVHQTFRLTSIIEDLLLLSRMEAGRLRINFTSVDINQIIERLVDDLTALPEALHVRVDLGWPALQVHGEKRYIELILQNLLENAWKYNRPGGEINIQCRAEDNRAVVVIANTGPAISSPAREQIFERFHRAAVGENIPGHGLGLSLARELARLHRGDLRLIRSDDQWTEFEVRFCLYASNSPQDGLEGEGIFEGRRPHSQKSPAL